MNEFIHFFTGYLIARGMKYRESRFECLLMSIAAFSIDFDSIIHYFIPSFAHGVWTHTILGALAMAILLACITWIFFRKNAEHPKLFLYLLGICVIGVLSHLALDSFTYYETSDDAVHHMFFWPLWNFPVHLNTVFPQATYELRVWIEVIYSVFVGVLILIVQWLIKHQNPLKMFIPKNWKIVSDKSEMPQFSGKTPLSLILYGIIMLFVFGFYFLDVFF